MSSLQPPHTPTDATVHHVTSSLAKSQFLIATRWAIGTRAEALDPAAMLDVVETALHEDPEIEVIKTLPANATSPRTRALVVRLSEDKAALLQQAGFERGVIVERDQLLALSHPAAPESAELGLVDVTAIAPLGTPLHVDVLVVGDNETPLAGTQIVLYGSGLPAEGITNAQGRARLTLSGNSLATVRALYVKPVADYWDTYVQQPQFESDKLNVIRLTSLAVQLPAWGLKAMRLDKDNLPSDYTGRGVKVAVVDSGIATTHPALTRVNTGIDLVDPLAIDGWRNDSISHGTHCAGVIGGAALSNVSIHGIAPEAELVAVKVFPRGHLSDLVAALDYAIAQQVDVVNLSLGSDLSSEIVEQKIIEAKANGVAVIVAAGNTGGPVQYPARSPHVLAVAAIGKLNEFPANTYHAHTVLGDRRLLGSEGYFSAKFSSYGEQVGVSGPGVAIISATSPTNYAVLDGTSVAASHITGLAALILAHHPDFKERFSARNAHRVERLFDILRQSARPIHVGDLRRVGAGLPDAIRALGLETRSVRGIKQPRETTAADYQALRDHLRSAGILNDGRETASARPSPQTAPGTAATRNGATGPHPDQRLVTSLLLAELRKRLENAHLRQPRRPIAEAE
ncbi:MAG: hypothetical protein RL701_4465 [Pseudomonadota bacterium]